MHNDTGTPVGLPTPADLLGAIPPLAWLVAALLALAIAGVLAWKLYRYVASRKLEDVLTIVAAAIATGVSAQGMWRFAGDVLGLDGPLRFLLFAFIEVAIVTSAVRARRNMREKFSAGIDGLAVWTLTCLTAVLSCMDARSIAEGIFRLAAPLVAAWLWERGMAVERYRITGLAGINWRLTPERVLVRLGLAEAKDRSTVEVDAHRRLTRVALAAKRVHQLREAGASDRKVLAAIAKRDRALDKAVEHTDLARDETKQAALLDLVTTLGGGDSLSDVLERAAAPWSHLDHRAVRTELAPAPVRDELEPVRPVRRAYVFRTAPRTEQPRTIRIARTFTFQAGPAVAPVRTIRRAFTFRTGPAIEPVRAIRRAFTFNVAPRTEEQPARTETVPVPVPVLADKETFVRTITQEILAAAERNDRWGPDYPELMTRTGRCKSWVEKRVREARTAVFRTEVAA